MTVLTGTTLNGNISSLAQAQFEGFFAAIETAPNLQAELTAFADALDLGFVAPNQTAQEIALTVSTYVIEVWNPAHTVQLGTVTYTGSGFNVTALGDPFVANDVFGVGSTITGIRVANLSDYTLWQYTGNMNIVTMAGGEVTQGSFNVTELRMGSPGAGVEMVLTGNLTVGVTSGIDGTLSGTITGMTQYVRQGGIAYKISIGGNLTPTADLIQDAMGDITSITSNVGGVIDTLSIDRYTYSDSAGQTQSGTTNLVSVSGLQMDSTDLQSLMFAMDHSIGPDMSFSTDGLVTTAVTTGDDYLSGIAIQADGKILVGGTAGGTAMSAPDHFAMARYNADGSPDTGFGTNGVVISSGISANAAIADAVVLTGGNILFAGSFMGDMGFGPGQHSIIGRFTSAGAIDSTFSAGGTDGDGFTILAYETSPVHAMAVQANNQILTAGDGFTLHRFSDVGVLDATFGTAGTVTPTLPGGVGYVSVADMVIQGDGKFLVAGTDVSTGSFIVARFNADGSLDTNADLDPGISFDSDGWAQVTVGQMNSHFSAMTLQADGKIVLVGTSFGAMGEDVVVARLNADGAPDMTFGFGGGKTYAGTMASDHGTSVVLDPFTNEIVVAGSDGSSALIWRFSSSGFMTSSSSTPLNVGNMGGVALARQADGALVIAGSEQTGPTTGTDWSVGRVVDSNMTMDQILFAGDDTLGLTGASDVGIEMAGFTGNDTITGGTGNDTLQGGLGNDSVVGSSGNDRLMGDDGIDTLVGGAGNDWLVGGPGNDTLDGGANGADTASYEFAITGVAVTLSGGGATVNDTLGGTDTLISIENIFGSILNDTLTGDVNANRLDGSMGDDSLDGGDGNDTLIGGSGFDTLGGGVGTDTVDYSSDQNANGDNLGVVVNLTGGAQTNSWQGVNFGPVALGTAMDGWGNTDTFVDRDAIENVQGSNYNDFIIGNGLANYINGGAGADLLIGLIGNDTLDGGSIGPDQYQDWVSYKSAAANTGLVAGVAVNLGTGFATGKVGSVDTDVLRNIDGITSSLLNDSLVGGSDSSDFKGLKQEFFNALAGDDTIDGGRGTTLSMDANNLEFNMALYHQSSGGVVVNLAAGTASGGDSGTDTLIGINAVRGSEFADTLTGGNPAFDHVEFFEGGGGDDVINGGSGFDFAMYTGATAGVSVTLVDGLTGTVTGDASVGSDTLQNIEGVVGSNFADTITGGTGNDLIQGRQGNDSITVGAGMDTIDYSADQNANGDNLGVVVNLSGGFQNNAWQGVFFGVASGQAQDGWGNFDSFADRGNIENIRGSIYNDFLVGNALGNNINGGDGADLLIGNTGNDTLDGGTIGDSKYQDWVSYLGAAANTAISPTTGVSVNLGTNTASGFAGSVDTDTLLNIDGVTGSNFNDTLVGGSSSTDFRGMKQEFFNGRNGDDILDGGRANNGVAMDAGNFEMNFALYHETSGFGVNVNLVAGTADGNGGANASVGSDTLIGINAVRGSNFADILTGGNTLFDYAEFFEGDGGNDTINGGAGSDYAMYRSAATSVTVDLIDGTALDGKGGTDTLTSIENVIGSDFDDVILGNASDNILQGRKGSDSFDGGTGTDTIDYGSDQNGNGDSLGVVVNLSGAAQNTSWQGVSFNVLSGQALDGWGNTDFFLNRDSLENIRGSIYNDFLVGNGFNNEIVGGKGDDLLIGLTGNDTLDGGTAGPDASSDWVSYFSAALNGTAGLDAGLNGVSVNLGTGTASGKAGNIDTDTLHNIDGVSGSTFNDSLVGGSDSSDFKGFKQEFFIGYAGNDTIDGGRAAVPMDASNVEMNMVLYHQTTGTVGVVVDLAAGSATGAAGIVDTDALIGINAVRGSNNNDTLTGGNALFDYLELFEGGGGNDSINGGSGFDYAMYTAATSGVNVNLVAGSATGDASVGTDILVSIEGVIGSSYSDTITGGAGNEKLQGRKGNDVLDGGAGTDWAYYDSDQDGNGDSFGVIVNLTQGSAVDGWGGIDTLVNFENIRGSIYSDNLTGDIGDNVVWGQAGNDTITGGQGLDTALYTGSKIGYQVTKGAGFFTVTDTNLTDGNDGTDTLFGIEKLQFTDGLTNLGKKLPGNDFNADGKVDFRWQTTDGSTQQLVVMDGINPAAYSQIIGPVPGWKIVSGQNDFNGDGKTDLRWENSTDGASQLVLMDGINPVAYSQIFGPVPGWKIVNEQSDFNGDGKTDMRWENITDGATQLVLLDGISPIAYSQVYGPIPGWKIVDSKTDFNGDGKTDLRWENTTDGASQLVLMDGINPLAYSQMYGPVAGWKIVNEQSDFNGDGKMDLRWENTTDGSTQIALLDGLNPIAFSQIYGPIPGWKIIDSKTDFNGDGKTDLRWENTTDGASQLVLMDGINPLAYSQIYGPVAGWKIVNEQSDFNGDGKMDLRWQNTSDGATQIVLLDGLNPIAYSQIYGPVPGWSIVAEQRDFNGDGKTDLRWQNNIDGATQLALMDGVNPIAFSQVYGPLAGWEVVV